MRELFLYTHISQNFAFTWHDLCISDIRRCYLCGIKLCDHTAVACLARGLVMYTVEMTVCMLLLPGAIVCVVCTFTDIIWHQKYANRNTRGCHKEPQCMCPWQIAIENRVVMMPTYSWWRHQMDTFSALLAICAGNSPVPGEFPTQRPVTRSFDVFFDLRLNKRLSEQSWGWWFETLSCSSWRHCNAWCQLIRHWRRRILSLWQLMATKLFRTLWKKYNTTICKYLHRHRYAQPCP